MNKNVALRVAGACFGLVSLLHLIRLIYNGNFIAFSYDLPMQVSSIGFVVALILSIWMFAASRN